MEDIMERFDQIELAVGQKLKKLSVVKHSVSDPTKQHLAFGAPAAADSDAAEAAVRTLERTPESPVVATMAASWGPDVTPILRSAVGHLRTRSSAHALRNQSAGYPAVAALLDTVARGMV